MNKLLNAGIALMSAGVVGILFAVVMEIQTGEPVYYLVMKITAGLFGVGGATGRNSYCQKKQEALTK
ncbi:unnamed protein product [marine sediment metagenome]|uniref:Uncharacterized protein n=1 Tax=marine sediment metagenome TaxID=412755 RepID=X1U4J5_9ZZZZ